MIFGKKGLVRERTGCSVRRGGNEGFSLSCRLVIKWCKEICGSNNCSICFL